MTEMRPSQTANATQGICYLIGVDGGGSGTRVQICLPNGRTIGRGVAGPSGLGQGIAQAWRHIGAAIADAFAEAGNPDAPPELCAVGLGLAGVNVAAWRDEFLRVAPAFRQLVLDSDAHTSVLGVHGGGPGAIVSAGTGSVGEALFSDGRRVSVGGWGFPVGDEGSGAWLGLAAMRIAQAAADGRGPHGELAQQIMVTTGGNAEAMQHWCVNAGQNAYAQLAPLVFECAEYDPAAERLLYGAAQELHSIAIALDPHATLPLALLGSIGRRLESRLPAATLKRCITPAGNASDGALHLICKAISDSE